MFENLFKFLGIINKDEILTVVRRSVTSSFYSRFFLSWLFWNWKLIYITFFVSEQLIKRQNIPITRIDWIIDNYYANTFFTNTCHFIILPAATAFLSFFILEIANDLSFIISTCSLWFRVYIQEIFERKTKASSEVLADFRKIKIADETDNDNLINELTKVKNDVKEKEIEIEKIRNELLQLKLSVLTPDEIMTVNNICKEIDGMNDVKGNEMMKNFIKYYNEFEENNGTLMISRIPDNFAYFLTKGIFQKVNEKPSTYTKSQLASYLYNRFFIELNRK